MGFSIGGDYSKSSSSGYSYLPIQETWLKRSLPMYGSQVGQGQPVYGDMRVAPLTTEQQGILGGANTWANYLTPDNMPMYGQTGSALSGILSGETGGEPYTKEAIDTLFKTAYEQPMQYQWNQYIQPEIREAYSGPGFWSTARMDAERRGAQDIGTWLGQQYGELTWGAEQANRALQEARAGRALSAIPMGLEYGYAPTQQALASLGGLQSAYGLTSQEQAQQQAEINAEMQRFIEENRITDPETLNAFMTLLGMNFNRETKSSSSGGFKFGF